LLVCVYMSCQKINIVIRILILVLVNIAIYLCYYWFGTIFLIGDSAAWFIAFLPLYYLISVSIAWLIFFATYVFIDLKKKKIIG
jgi:hypothetical protein